MEKIKLFIKDCAKYKNKYYCIAENLNLIFSIDENSSEISLIDCKKDFPLMLNGIFGALAIKNEKMYIAPNKNDNIIIYDLKDLSYKEISIKKYDYKQNGKFLSIKEYKNYLIFIGSFYPALIIYDTNNNQMKYIEKPFLDKRNVLHDAFFRTHHILIDDTLFLASCVDNSVLKYNLNNDKFDWIIIGNENNRYSGISFDGTNFWLSPRTNSAIVRWDGNKEVCEFDLPEIFNMNNNYFLGLYCENNSIILPNMINPFTLKIDENNDYTIINKKFKFQKTIQSDILIQTSSSEFLINRKSEIKRYILEIDYEIIKEFYASRGMHFDLSDLMFEGEVVDLNSYITLMKNNDCKNTIVSNVGLKIYQRLKSE